VHIKNALSFVAKLSVGGIKSGFLQGFLFLGLNLVFDVLKGSFKKA